jgi:hypothetical protein
MLQLLARGEAPSVNAAAAKVAAGSRSRWSEQAYHTRLRQKFAVTYGTQPPDGKTWADVARELQAN